MHSIVNSEKGLFAESVAWQPKFQSLISLDTGDRGGLR